MFPPVRVKMSLCQMMGVFTELFRVLQVVMATIGNRTLILTDAPAASGLAGEMSAVCCLTGFKFCKAGQQSDAVPHLSNIYD